MVHYRNYAAENDDLRQFLGGFKVINYDGTNDKPEKIFERCTFRRGTM